MELSKKVLAILIIIAVTITAVAMAAIFVPSVSNWFSANTGGWGATLLSWAQSPLRFGLIGGAQTVFIYALGIAALFGFAYWVWHWDIGYKLSSATKPISASSGYDNSVRREPDEPERSNTPVIK